MNSNRKTDLFYLDDGNTRASYITVSNGSSTTSFWFKGATQGFPTITASATVLTPIATKFKISR